MDQDISIPSTPIDVLQKGNPPQKYIRTYARDIATVQRGGTPDLVPLGEAKQAPTITTSSTGVPTVPFTPPPPSLHSEQAVEVEEPQEPAPAPVPAPTSQPTGA